MPWPPCLRRVPRFSRNKSQGLGALLLHLKVGVQSDTFSCCLRYGLERPIEAHTTKATDARIISATINRIFNACNRFWGCGREWPHSMCHGCATGSQIQDLALILGADGACMGLDKDCGTNSSPNPLGGMFGRDWCRRGGKIAATM